MMHFRDVEFALIALVAIFMIMGWIFRKKLAYISCPLPPLYRQGYERQSHYLSLFHFVISLGLAISTYAILDTFPTFSIAFRETSIRLLTILLLWITYFYLSGLLIERYLEYTDDEYKRWKKKDQ